MRGRERGGSAAFEVPDGDPELLRAAAVRFAQAAGRALATAAVRGDCAAELSLVWSGATADQAQRDLDVLSSRARALVPHLSEASTALRLHAAALEHAIGECGAIRRLARDLEDVHARTVGAARFGSADPVGMAHAIAVADEQYASARRPLERRYGRALDALSEAAAACARTLGRLTASSFTRSCPSAPIAMAHELTGDLPFVQRALTPVRPLAVDVYVDPGTGEQYLHRPPGRPEETVGPAGPLDVARDAGLAPASDNLIDVTAWSTATGSLMTAKAAPLVFASLTMNPAGPLSKVATNRMPSLATRSGPLLRLGRNAASLGKVAGPAGTAIAQNVSDAEKYPRMSAGKRMARTAVSTGLSWGTGAAAGVLAAETGPGAVVAGLAGAEAGAVAGRAVNANVDALAPTWDDTVRRVEVTPVPAY